MKQHQTDTAHKRHCAQTTLRTNDTAHKCSQNFFVPAPISFLHAAVVLVIVGTKWEEPAMTIRVRLVTLAVRVHTPLEVLWEDFFAKLNADHGIRIITIPSENSLAAPGSV